MSIGSKTAGVLTGATNILLGTSFRTPTLGSLSLFGNGSSKPPKPPKPPKQPESASKEELAEIGSILADIRESLNSYLAASALAPKMLLDIQAERKKSADFLAGMVEGMRTEMLENGQLDNESLKAFLDGFYDSIKEFTDQTLIENRDTAERTNDALEDLGQRIDQDDGTKLDDQEIEREAASLEEKRHKEIVTLLAIIAYNGRAKETTGKPAGGGIGDMLGGLAGLGGLLGLGGLAGGGGLLGGLGRAAGLLGKIVPFIGIAIGVVSGIMDLLDGKAQKEIPEGLKMLSPFHWGMYIGDKFNSLYEIISKYFGGSGSLGSDLYDTVESLKTKWNEFTTWAGEMWDSWSWEGIKQSWSDGIQSIKDKIDSIKNDFTAKFEEVKLAIIEKYNSIVDGIIEKIDSIKEGFASFKERLQAKFEEFKKSISEFFDPEMWKQKALEGIAGAKEEIGRIFDESMAKVQEFIGESGKRISEFFEGIVETIQLIFGDISKLIGGAKDAVLALGKSLFSKDKENEADTNIKIIEEEDTKLKERIRVLSRSGGRAGESQEQKERKRAEIEEIEKQREELKAARDYQESTHKKSLNNIDKQLETATGIDKEELLAQRERIVAASKADARIAVGEILDRTKIESIAQADPIDLIEEKPERRRGGRGSSTTAEQIEQIEQIEVTGDSTSDLIEEKPERRRGGRSTAKTQIEAIENDETEGSQLEPETPKKQSRRSRRSAKDQEPEIKTDSDLIVIEKPSEIDPLFISPQRSPIEKLDPAKDPNSLYSQMMEESAISMTDAAAKDAAAIISGSSSVSIDSTLREQKQITQSSTTSVSTVTVAPIFARGILPGISMNQ